MNFPVILTWIMPNFEIVDAMTSIQMNNSEFQAANFCFVKHLSGAGIPIVMQVV